MRARTIGRTFSYTLSTMLHDLVGAPCLRPWRRCVSPPLFDTSPRGSLGERNEPSPPWNSEHTFLLIKIRTHLSIICVVTVHRDHRVQRCSAPGGGHLHHRAAHKSLTWSQRSDLSYPTWLPIPRPCRARVLPSGYKRDSDFVSHSSSIGRAVIRGASRRSSTVI